MGTPPASISSFVLSDTGEVLAKTRQGTQYVVVTDQAGVAFRNVGVAPPDPQPKRDGLDLRPSKRETSTRRGEPLPSLERPTETREALRTTLAELRVSI